MLGSIVARESGVPAGIGFGLRAFTLVDASVATEVVSADGDPVEAGAVVATVSGPARAVLAAERTCLNLIGHLSGIATATRRLVAAVAHTDATVVDTRKTTPGLRSLEKYAVRAGGGSNHRFGLHDAVLIKDNHVAALGGDVARAVRAAREAWGVRFRVQVEIDDLGQLEDAITAGADAILLDNMAPVELRKAVELASGRVELEASGGITESTIAAVAETGVDFISVGALTHSVTNWDVGLDVETTDGPPGPVTRPD